MDATAEDTYALAQPTRARLFDVLSSQKRPMATDELAERLGRHPNGIRQHLEVLDEAGLLTRERERRGRGRPRDLWSINPRAMPEGKRPTAYAELSRWLARALAGGAGDPEEVEARGHQIGQELAEDGDADANPATRFQDALAAMGFHPGVKKKSGDEVTFCLNNCPYRDAVLERREVICSLHRGITSGLLSKIEPSSSLTGFVAKDPREAGCLVKVQGPLAAPAG